MGPIIDIIRHTEAWHNVSRDSYIRDPGLTPNGEAQSYQLRDEYPFMSKVSHVVCSPLRRAVATALIAFDPVVSNGKKAILLPDLQVRIGELLSPLCWTVPGAIISPNTPHSRTSSSYPRGTLEDVPTSPKKKK